MKHEVPKFHRTDSNACLFIAESLLIFTWTNDHPVCFLQHGRLAIKQMSVNDIEGQSSINHLAGLL